MKILINASNLKVGGGLQVADSVCRELYKFPQHKFVVVLSSYLNLTKKNIEQSDNIAVYSYDVKNNITTLFWGRDSFLDGLVEKHNIESVLTIFGPSMWIPRVAHLSGFAIPHYVLPESPFFLRLNWKKKLEHRLRFMIKKNAFQRSAKYYFTENPMISDRLEKLLRGKTVYTVTNYYNQVFDYPEQWKEIVLPEFGGVSMLTITAAYPHKNLSIAAEVARLLKLQHPEFKFRFVFSIEKKDFGAEISDIEECFVFLGRVDISECPSLYRQCSIAFQPSLLECFSATYPEAMRMEIPIVTTDLGFAKGLCGDAAEYYSAVDAQSAADAIYRVATDAKLSSLLVSKGKEQLKTYDTYTQRAEKLINLVSSLK